LWSELKNGRPELEEYIFPASFYCILHTNISAFSPHSPPGPVWAISGRIRLSFWSRKIVLEGVEEYFIPITPLRLRERDESTLYFFQIQNHTH
jgi:hypothetical protein